MVVYQQRRLRQLLHREYVQWSQPLVLRHRQLLCSPGPRFVVTFNRHCHPRACPGDPVPKTQNGQGANAVCSLPIFPPPFCSFTSLFSSSFFIIRFPSKSARQNLPYLIARPNFQPLPPSCPANSGLSRRHRRHACVG